MFCSASRAILVCGPLSSEHPESPKKEAFTFHFHRSLCVMVEMIRAEVLEAEVVVSLVLGLPEAPVPVEGLLPLLHAVRLVARVVHPAPPQPCQQHTQVIKLSEK